MQGSAKLLEETLHQATCQWSFPCIVCNAEMGRGAQDHLPSHNHWKNLWKKFDNGRLPESHLASGLDQKWTQEFVTRRGTYKFNHLTGEQGWTEMTAEGSATSVPQASAPVMPSQAPGSVLLQPQQQITTDVWDDGEQVAMAQRQFPQTQSATAPAVLTGASIANAQQEHTSPPTPQACDAYRNGIQDRRAWRSLMERPGKELEDLLWSRFQLWGGPCLVCDADMSRGVAEHLPSQNHWRQLWDRLAGQVPEFQAAHSWTARWVQRFETAEGVYLFNHVTGRHGFENELLGTSFQTPESGAVMGATFTTHPVAASAPAPTPASQVPTPVAAPAPMPEPTEHASRGSPQPPATDPTQGFDLFAWAWDKHIRETALNLHHALGGHNAGHFCQICKETIQDNISTHLSTQGHANRLRRQAAESNLSANDPVWWQKFHNVYFHHICGDLWSQGSEEAAIVGTPADSNLADAGTPPGEAASAATQGAAAISYQ